MIGFYRILTEANSSNREFMKLPFLKETESYLVNGEKLSGSVLKKWGLESRINLIVLIRIKHR